MKFFTSLYYAYYDRPPVMEQDTSDQTEEQLNENKEKRLQEVYNQPNLFKSCTLKLQARFD
jgi:hypothetical protein